MRAMPLLMICFCSLLLTGDAFSQTEEIKDWPMWGGTAGRNMVSGMKGVSTDFDLEKGTKVNWSVGLGSQTYGNPIIADGKVFVGTNNGAVKYLSAPTTEPATEINIRRIRTWGCCCASMRSQAILSGN